ncbi:Polyketide cyclase / dehydrase and lipid transport [Tenacibaculum sp. MAR_2009_124]|uniref:SRPBCC family protein n=1 Tax=Tenacibaculum sp. MAR_2009_124 TaxID=1250059 RepID=UPI000896CEE6|nr:SRPBCC family protein [Tenacibaculum sp. MAR_2009_124]SEB41330.1 Polyketide cyclase / dehydrase and lipid transport [Tenacibaculum sp. MAR_2009_124]
MLKFRMSVLLLIFTLTIVSCSDSSEEVPCTADTTIDFPTSTITQIEPNKHRVYTDIVINGSAEEVWNILTDFTNMPDWSSSFQGLSGEINNNSEVTITYILPSPTTGEPTESQFNRTLSYIEGQQFGWSTESTTFPGIIDNHIFKVEAISDCQSRFIQTDEYQGTNSFFTTNDLANASIPLYNQFNTELKGEVEKQ